MRRKLQSVHAVVCMIDSLAYLKKLEAAGVPRLQAEAQVGIMVEAFNSNLATKEDVARSELAMRTDFANLRAEFGDLLVKVDGMENRLMLKLGGLMIGLFTVGSAVMGGVLGLIIKHS